MIRKNSISISPSRSRRNSELRKAAHERKEELLSMKQHDQTASKADLQQQVASMQFYRIERLLEKDHLKRTAEEIEEIRKEILKTNIMERFKISPDAAKDFASIIRIKAFNFPGMPIKRAGDAGDMGFMVMSGCIRLVQKRQSEEGFGGNETVATLNPGDVAGEDCLLKDMPWEHTLIVSVPAVAIVIPKDEYDIFIRPYMVNDQEKVLRTLRNCYALEAFSVDEIKEMMEFMSLRRVTTGALLCTQGYTMNDILIVCKGLAQVYRDSNNTVSDAVARAKDRKWDTSILVGELWNSDFVDPSSLFGHSRQPASYTAVAASVMDLIVIPYVDMNRVFKQETKQKIVRFCRTFPQGKDLKKAVKEVAKWRKYSRDLVTSILKNSRFSERLIGPPLPLSQTCGYDALPVIGKISPGPGQDVPFAKSVAQEPLSPLLSVPSPFSPGFSAAPRASRESIKERFRSKSVTPTPTKLMKISMQLQTMYA